MNTRSVNTENSRVLIVDDVDVNVQVAKAILQKDGLQILTASDGPSALKTVRSSSVDLILLDIMMPRMDGFSVIEVLKNDSKTKDVPVIFLTARNDEESLTRAFDLGAVDYITKPFRGAELRMRVRNHLQLRLIRQQLEEANAAKDKFFSIIAHDLRSPFTSLLGMSQYLAKGIDELDADVAKEFLEGIHTSSKNAFNLLENLLEWSRIQTGRLPMSPEELDLADIVEENLSLYEVNISAKELMIVNNLNTPEPAYVDENSANMVVRNVLSNAIKFTPRGGTIELSSRRTDSEVFISIKDSGEGIDPDIMDKLFRIDVRNSSHGTEMEKGSGLGLILCKEFLEKNGGSIQADSEPGQGAVFTFRLPSQRRS